MSEHRVTLPAKRLHRAIRAIAPVAASPKVGRPALTCVHVQLTDTSMTLTASNSYQLNRGVVPLITSWGGPSSACSVPAAWLSRWAAQPWVKADSATVIVTDRRFAIHCGDDERSIGRQELNGPRFPIESSEKILTEQRPEPVETDEAVFDPARYAAVFKACAAWSSVRFADGVHCKAFDPIKPCVFTFTDPDTGDLEMIVMPMRMRS